MKSSAVIVIVVGGLVAMWLARRRWVLRVDALHSAAKSGHIEQLRRELDRGTAVNSRNDVGNTALHFACYFGLWETVAVLEALGAKHNLRNNEGFTPSELGAVGAAERLLRDGVRCLDERVCDQLRACEGRIFDVALERAALDFTQRHKLLRLAVKVGRRGHSSGVGIACASPEPGIAIADNAIISGTTRTSGTAY